MNQGEGLVSDSIFAMGEDADRGIWFGTDRGCSRLRDGVWTSYHRADGLPSEPGYVAALAAHGSAWRHTSRKWPLGG